ncbi:helix-turn-helix transcriptional regulator [Listeria welshimeri]|uniref:helix-turn-helix domain-containing protein n=1 Tax=Listeria welshimeri TaxID=1643 RepID=UPI00162A420F|nr:AraC family transcriptional regulator [Listeria welshimeri]MBC1340717.1 helix-turn-helix transcriptional regulator [Listeria welshimeri]MBC1346763.1 helix-turn-helix transcriptional regulator [Listeria welshimeri]MBC1396575.1 helix-turn-helix transcriptional regulator [Listeria welshimeri]MBC1608672.1 helix-turn-helix transcriptional regulator [Listeria welshimeri]MBC1627649.1 helix-turn-helix transcriptional regulator [Listeria welshimeri]
MIHTESNFKVMNMRKLKLKKNEKCLIEPISCILLFFDGNELGLKKIEEDMSLEKNECAFFSDFSQLTLENHSKKEIQLMICSLPVLKNKGGCTSKFKLSKELRGLLDLLFSEELCLEQDTQESLLTIITSKVLKNKYNSSYSKVINGIIEYLEKNIYTNINLDKLSEISFLSKSRLCILFKQETGTSIITYFTTMKIRKAKELINDNDKNISEISEMLGFKNLQYFSNVFRKNTGLCPTKYRKKLFKM